MSGARSAIGIARPKRSFDREFKLQVVRQWISGEKRLAQLCREHQLAESMVRRWREQYEHEGENAWPETAALLVERDASQRIRELEATLGRNHKRVYRLMRQAGLLQGRWRGQVRTTDSEHG